jgi:hypothetical protein
MALKVRPEDETADEKLDRLIEEDREILDVLDE